MKKSEMNTKLEPCPFCGTKVEMMRIPLWHGSHGYQNCYDFKVTCEKCGCTLNYAYADTIYRTEEEAINNVTNAWNERKNETAVTPKPKTGHWINKKPRWIPSLSMTIHDAYECSNCGEPGVHWWKYCINCGARMIEPQERSGEK